MELSQIRALLVVVEEGSFRAAAAKLNLVQSAISYQIKMLEEAVGFAIFDRQGYRPVLTEPGRAFHQKCKSLLYELEDLEVFTRELASGREAALKVNVSPLCSLSEIAALFNEFTSSFSNVELQITMEVFGGEKWVLDGTMDLAFVPAPKIQPQLESTFFRSVTLIPVVSGGHFLSSQKKITRSQLLKSPQISVSSGMPEMKGEKRGILEGVKVWSVSDMHSKKELLLAGLGWGTLPCHFMESELAEGSLKRLDIPFFPGESVRIHMVRARYRARGPAAKELWRLGSNLAQFEVQPGGRPSP